MREAQLRPTHCQVFFLSFQCTSQLASHVQKLPNQCGTEKLTKIWKVAQTCHRFGNLSNFTIKCPIQATITNWQFTKLQFMSYQFIYWQFKKRQCANSEFKIDGLQIESLQLGNLWNDIVPNKVCTLSGPSEVFGLTFTFMKWWFTNYQFTNWQFTSYHFTNWKFTKLQLISYQFTDWHFTNRQCANSEFTYWRFTNWQLATPQLVKWHCALLWLY